eukprot:scaffold1687_cov405-Prasinococcus_capsulatus_cf.AAC.30
MCNHNRNEHGQYSFAGGGNHFGPTIASLFVTRLTLTGLVRVADLPMVATEGPAAWVAIPS